MIINYKHLICDNKRETTVTFWAFY